MNQTDKFPVVIIGGGLAGLTAALLLAERDIPPLVLEADSAWPGGRLAGGEAETFEYEGQTWQFDSQHGVHALWGGYDNMRAVLDRFDELVLIPSEGEEWINRWGMNVRAVEAGTAIRNARIPPPLHYLQLLLRPRFWKTITPLDFLSLPGFLISLIWSTGLDPIQEEIDLDGLMMDEFFRGWTPNLRATFSGLAHSLLAAPSESITLTALISAVRFYTMLRRDTWRIDYIPGNAHERLIQPMIDKIEGMGGMIMMGVRAEELIRENDGWRVRVDDAKRGGTRTVIAEQIILAVDPPAAQRLLTGSPSTQKEAAAMRFPPGLENASIRLWFDAMPRKGTIGGMFSGDFGIDNFFWLHRMNEDCYRWHKATGGSAIETHLYSPARAFEQTDEMLLIMATNEIQRAFPKLRGHFVHGVVRRNGPTQTQFLIPTAKSLHLETPWPDLYACGDWIGYPSPALWMERSTVTAIAAANHILRAHNAEPFPIIPPRKPEWLARILGGIVRILRKTLGRIILKVARTLRGS